MLPQRIPEIIIKSELIFFIYCPTAAALIFFRKKQSSRFVIHRLSKIISYDKQYQCNCHSDDNIMEGPNLIPNAMVMQYAPNPPATLRIAPAELAFLQNRPSSIHQKNVV